LINVGPFYTKKANKEQKNGLFIENKSKKKKCKVQNPAALKNMGVFRMILEKTGRAVFSIPYLYEKRPFLESFSHFFLFQKLILY
jgi:hypothetical protein